MNKIFLDNNDLLITNAVEDDKFLRIEGSAAHFDVPNLNGEIVSESSFDEFFELYSDGKIRPALTYNHDANMLIGGIDNVYIQNNTLMCKAHINKDIEFCKNTLIEMILSGDCKSFSTEGFLRYSDIVENEDGTYFASSFMLTAISVVTVPADYQSEFTIKNSIERIKQAKIEEAKKQSKWYLIR